MDVEKQIVPVTTEKTPSVINWNYKEIKNKLSDFLTKYEGYVVSEDTLKSDKSTRAELNKVSKSINDFRKTVKTEVSKPIDTFEEQCKELTGMVEDVSSKIDSEIKEFEAQEKEKQRERAENIIHDLAKESELPEEYTKRIDFKDSFTNLTTTGKQVEKDVSEQITALQNEYNQYLQNVETVKATVEAANKRIKSELYVDDYVEQLKFKELSDVVSLINARADEIVENEKKTEEKTEEKPTPAPKVEKKEEPEFTVSLEITATKAQFSALKEFFTTNNINYKKN